MRAFRRLWRRWSGFDLWPWRRLRQLRLLRRALLRDNEVLRRRVKQLEIERAAIGQSDYWYRRWDELRQRPAFFAQDVALARAHAEKELIQRELRSLRQIMAGRPAGRPEDRGPESDPSAGVVPKRGP